MDKLIPSLLLTLILAFALSECKPVAPASSTTQIEHLQTHKIARTPALTETLVGPISVEQQPTPILAPSTTMIPINTLEPEKANEMIETLMQEPVECSAACFWGIISGQTTDRAAMDIFSYLGLKVESYSYESKVLYSISFVLDSGLSTRATLTIINHVVEGIHLRITPERQNVVNPRDWEAYSPETLIKQYGLPSRVDFGADWGPRLFLVMQIYYDEADLVIQYTSTSIIPSKEGALLVCPLIAQFDTVWLWMGKNPIYPPEQGVPLEEVTSLSIEEYSQLLSGDPEEACFIVDVNAFK